MPSSTRALTAVASALVLSACATVGPNFRAPEGPQGPAAAGYAMAGDAQPAGPRLTPEARTAGPWWQAFGSPELDRVVREALADSPTIAEATATLQRAQAQAAATRGAELPQVEATAGAQRERINVQSFGLTGFPSPTVNLWSVGATVSYDLDLFGGRRRATEAAEAQAQAEARNADAAYLTLSGNVALQALRIASLRSQLANVQAIVADDQRVIDMVRRAHEAGGRPPSAITLGQSQVAQDEALLPPLQRELDAARHRLALLVGKPPAAWTAPDFDMTAFTAPAEIPVALPSTLVRARPDILAAEAALHAATARIGVAVANQYPNINLSADLIQTTLEPGNLFRYASSGWSLGGSLTAPLFHGGTLKAERQAAEADARAADARYRRTVLQAFVQVSDVLAALGSDQQSIAALSRAQASAEASARDAQSAYRLGGGALLSVIDAQRTLNRARLASVQAEGQRYADLVQLYAATATDWRSPGT